MHGIQMCQLYSLPDFTHKWLINVFIPSFLQGCSTADAAECMETDVVEGVESSDFTDSPPQSSERMEGMNTVV